MSKPTAISVTAVCASLLVAAALALSLTVARASDNCLVAPTDPAPQGSHWYRHIDRATQRDCWYLREARPGSAQVAPQNALPLAKLISPQALTTASGSIAEARAELPAPVPPPEEEPTRDIEPTPTVAAETRVSEDNGVTKAPAAETHRSMLMAALALAGVTGSALFKLGSLRRRPRRARVHKRRSAIWAPADLNRRTTSGHSLDDFRRPSDYARDLDRARELRVRGREIFSQLSKGSPP